MREFRVEFLANCIERMSNDTMLAIINEYNDSMGNSNIYLNDENGIESICGGMTYDAILRAVSYGDYSYTDRFIWFNDYGNICSSDDILGVSFCEVAEWMIDEWNENAKDAWVIFNASSMVETGDIYDDLVDELQYRFSTQYELDSIAEWVESETTETTSFASWVRESWVDLEEEFNEWCEENEDEWNKTLDRCGLI